MSSREIVETTLKKHNCENSTLILGISGGSDSMYMLKILSEIAPKLNLKLIVAHVNHMLRGNESDTDEKFVKMACNSLKIKCESAKINIKKFQKSEKLNLESAARTKRYEFLRKIKGKYKAKFILLAHNATDNTETVLLNLIRGTSIRGLSGISELNGDILRPLLPFSKKEIEKYCKKENIKFRIDKTNFDIKLKRNFIRHKLIPQIEKLNPNFTQTTLKKSQYFKQAHEFLSNLAENWVNSNCKIEKHRITCDSKILAKEKGFLKKLIIENIYEKFNGSTLDLESTHIDELLKVINKNVGNKEKQIGTRIGIKKISGKAIFYKTASSKPS